jgi:hypothetical protein
LRLTRNSNCVITAEQTSAESGSSMAWMPAISRNVAVELAAIGAPRTGGLLPDVNATAN